MCFTDAGARDSGFVLQTKVGSSEACPIRQPRLSEPVLACVVELLFAQLVGVDSSGDAPAVVDRTAMQVGP
jgi:hypothetical protein